MKDYESRFNRLKDIVTGYFYGLFRDASLGRERLSSTIHIADNTNQELMLLKESLENDGPLSHSTRFIRYRGRKCSPKVRVKTRREMVQPLASKIMEPDDTADSLLVKVARLIEEVPKRKDYLQKIYKRFDRELSLFERFAIVNTMLGYAEASRDTHLEVMSPQEIALFIHRCQEIDDKFAKHVASFLSENFDTLTPLSIYEEGSGDDRNQYDFGPRQLELARETAVLNKAFHMERFNIAASLYIRQLLALARTVYPSFFLAETKKHFEDDVEYVLQDIDQMDFDYWANDPDVESEPYNVILSRRYTSLQNLTASEVVFFREVLSSSFEYDNPKPDNEEHYPYMPNLRQEFWDMALLSKIADIAIKYQVFKAEDKDLFLFYISGKEPHDYFIPSHPVQCIDRKAKAGKSKDNITYPYEFIYLFVHLFGSSNAKTTFNLKTIDNLFHFNADTLDKIIFAESPYVTLAQSAKREFQDDLHKISEVFPVKK